LRRVSRQAFNSSLSCFSSSARWLNNRFCSMVLM
jgi:hypothetical protein